MKINELNFLSILSEFSQSDVFDFEECMISKLSNTHTKLLIDKKILQKVDRDKNNLDNINFSSYLESVVYYRDKYYYLSEHFLNELRLIINTWMKSRSTLSFNSYKDFINKEFLKYPDLQTRLVVLKDKRNKIIDSIKSLKKYNDVSSTPNFLPSYDIIKIIKDTPNLFAYYLCNLDNENGIEWEMESIAHENRDGSNSLVNLIFEWNNIYINKLIVEDIDEMILKLSEDEFEVSKRSKKPLNSTQKIYLFDLILKTPDWNEFSVNRKSKILKLLLGYNHDTLRNALDNVNTLKHKTTANFKEDCAEVNNHLNKLGVKLGDPTD